MGDSKLHDSTLTDASRCFKHSYIHMKVLKGILIMFLSLQVLVGSARNMYNCCVEGMNFEEFFEGEIVILRLVK